MWGPALVLPPIWRQWIDEKIAMALGKDASEDEEWTADYFLTMGLGDGGGDVFHDNAEDGFEGGVTPDEVEEISDNSVNYDAVQGRVGKAQCGRRVEAAQRVDRAREAGLLPTEMSEGEDSKSRRWGLGSRRG